MQLKHDLSTSCQVFQKKQSCVELKTPFLKKNFEVTHSWNFEQLRTAESQISLVYITDSKHFTTGIMSARLDTFDFDFFDNFAVQITLEQNKF